MPPPRLFATSSTCLRCCFRLRYPTATPSIRASYHRRSPAFQWLSARSVTTLRSRIEKRPEAQVRRNPASDASEHPNELHGRNVEILLPASELEKRFRELKTAAETQLLSEQAGNGTPDEADVIKVLSDLRILAGHRIATHARSAGASKAGSAILGLGDAKTQGVRKTNAPVTFTPETPSKFQPLPPLSDISSLSYSILSHPRVFISAPVLSAFVSLQAMLRDASSIPNVFALYATKPIYRPGGDAKVPNSKAAKYSIPPEIAENALDVAIAARDMHSALDIIDTSFATSAFRRAKLIRKLVPLGGIGLLAPGAIYVAADKLANLQDEVDHTLAMKYAATGIGVYILSVTSMGLIALMTSNDQMVRVTWVPGIPLRERWLKEEERSALDKVAQAWGFEEEVKRSTEEGEEWELLREVCGRKGMWLDNPALMAGME